MIIRSTQMWFWISAGLNVNLVWLGHVCDEQLAGRLLDERVVVLALVRGHLRV